MQFFKNRKLLDKETGPAKIKASVISWCLICYSFENLQLKVKET